MTKQMENLKASRSRFLDYVTAHVWYRLRQNLYIDIFIRPSSIDPKDRSNNDMDTINVGVDDWIYPSQDDHAHKMKFQMESHLMVLEKMLKIFTTTIWL